MSAREDRTFCVAVKRGGNPTKTPSRASLQPREPAFALHNILVVPLDLDGFLEPPFEVIGGDLIIRGVPGFGGLENALGSEARFVKRLAAPEQEAHAILEFAIPDDRVVIEEPYRLTVPHPALRAGQMLIDCARECIADPLVAARL